MRSAFAAVCAISPITCKCSISKHISFGRRKGTLNTVKNGNEEHGVSTVWWFHAVPSNCDV